MYSVLHSLDLSQGTDYPEVFHRSLKLLHPWDGILVGPHPLPFTQIYHSPVNVPFNTIQSDLLTALLDKPQLNK